jgi:hypothetical protein
VREADSRLHSLHFFGSIEALILHGSCIDRRRFDERRITDETRGLGPSHLELKFGTL